MKWLSAPVGGQNWRVDLVRKKHPIFEGDNCFGITIRDKCRVYIAKEFEEPIRESTAVHELFGHVAFRVSGASQIIFELCNNDEEKAEKAEEDIVSRLELVWYPLFLHFGFRFPKGIVE